MDNTDKTTKKKRWGGGFLLFTKRHGQHRHQPKEDQRHRSPSLIGGVYVVPAELDVKPIINGKSSARTMDTRSETESESVDTSTVTKTPPGATIDWSPSNDPDFHKDAPLLARRPVDVQYLVGMDDQAALGHVMFQARKLPQSPGPFASNHVMINGERTKRMIQPLTRSPTLDELAREHARTMASQQCLKHTQDPLELQERLLEVVATTTASGIESNSNNNNGLTVEDCERIGENVCRGKSLKDMHRLMMQSVAEKNNILDRRFASMGVGTAKGDDGLLYLCQIFCG